LIDLYKGSKSKTVTKFLDLRKIPGYGVGSKRSKEECLDVGKVTNDKGLIQIRDEIYIMSELDHPNIVRLKEVYLSNDKIYLIMEVCQGGDLFDRLNEQPNNHYTEQQCAILVNQMLKAVRYIHSKGIVHRDLKLENFLFSTRAPDSQLKLIDFGISKHFSGSLKESVGTPYTVAPEVILGKYDERCDMWSIGVLTYLLLSGETPFGGCDDESLEAVRNRILSGSLVFEPKHVWSNVSQQGKEFVRKLLVTDPNDRLFAREAQKSEWLKQWAVKGKEPRNSLLNPGVVKSLASFKEHSVVQKLLCRLVSYTLLPDQIEDLRIEFEKLDTDDLGEITLDDLKTVLFEMAEMGAVSLNEAEVEDICNAMLIQRSGNKIRWHDFIAAGLSYCKVDYRNLQLAFDKLDKENKGYIVFYDIAGLAGSDADESMKTLAEVIQCQKPIIIYEKLSRNFKVITKLETGQIIVQDENSRY